MSGVGGVKVETERQKHINKRRLAVCGIGPEYDLPTTQACGSESGPTFLCSQFPITGLFGRNHGPAFPASAYGQRVIRSELRSGS